jgi:hypothetical protein
MEKYNMNELEIKFNMVKSNGKDFTDDEIDDFNNDFIDLVEKHSYLVAGSIGPYVEDDECSDDDFDFEEIDEFDVTVSDDFQIGPDGAFEFDEDLHKPKKKRNKPSNYNE